VVALEGALVGQKQVQSTQYHRYLPPLGFRHEAIAHRNLTGAAVIFTKFAFESFAS
jgi:hypothetical protein